MRGKVNYFEPCVALNRITPAYAGKRQLWPKTWRWVWNHPRVCGEKYLSVSLGLLKQGSPPHMRGKDRRAPLLALGHGITPACAGKRRCWSIALSRSRDHPRVCGEKSSSATGSALGSGSPPRMRGKAILRSGELQALGITPAYAGKRPDGDRLPAERQDHPRVCGEKAALPILLRYHRGSPPRMRGKVLRCQNEMTVVGITPAYAGKRERAASVSCL